MSKEVGKRAPLKVKYVRRLHNNLGAINVSLASEEPYRVHIGFKKTRCVWYRMGDVSVDRFGVVLFIDSVLLFRYGQ